MPLHPGLVSSRRLWVSLALVLGVTGGLALAWRWFLPAQRVLRVLIVRADVPGSDPLAPGLETLLTDHLEVLAGATVTHATTLPSPAELAQLPADQWVLSFEGRRSGSRLALTSRWTTSAQLRAGRPWLQAALPPQEPRSALNAWIQGWPLPARPRFRADLLPQSADRFWDLLAAMSIREDAEATAQLPATQRLVDDEPACATAWLTLGDHLYRSLWVLPGQAGIGLNSRTQRAFQRAVELVPGHPRATFLWSLMLTDTGNQDQALRLLGAAVHLRPHAADLYLGFAYAGRTAGLLAGARESLRQRKRLLGPLAQPSAWFAETTYLYQGDWPAFEAELSSPAPQTQNATMLFYRGYFALLRGDRSPALPLFRAGATWAQEPDPFQILCQAYVAHLEGRPGDGLALLRRADEVRGKLRVPDGEWTFKEAEAYALLGDSERAMDCATRAFVQGFSCDRWYENSPFLQPMRAHPRWPMLQRNIRERRAGLEGTFPVSAFTP